MEQIRSGAWPSTSQPISLEVLFTKATAGCSSELSSRQCTPGSFAGADNQLLPLDLAPVIGAWQTMDFKDLDSTKEIQLGLRRELRAWPVEWRWISNLFTEPEAGQSIKVWSSSFSMATSSKAVTVLNPATKLTVLCQWVVALIFRLEACRCYVRLVFSGFLQWRERATIWLRWAQKLLQCQKVANFLLPGWRHWTQQATGILLALYRSSA